MSEKSPKTQGSIKLKTKTRALELLAPYVAFIILFAVAVVTAVYVKKRKNCKD